jgi:thiol:disulfide interchange protein DsbD
MTKTQTSLKNILLVWLAIAAGPTAFSQPASTTETIQAHSVGRIVASHDGLVPGQTISVGLAISMEDGWHTYWQNPGDSGAAPDLDFILPEGFKVGSLIYARPKRISMPPLTSFAYEDKTIFFADIQVPKTETLGNERQIKILAEWLVCREECIPAVFDFAMSLKVKTEAAKTEYGKMIDEARASIARGEAVSSGLVRKGNFFELSIPVNAGIEITDLFPFPGLPTTNASPQLERQNDRYRALVEYERKDTAKSEDALRFLALARDSQGRETAFVVEGTSGDHSLASMLVLAFLGGLILNLMPCVFPILALKLFGVVKASHRGKLFGSNLVYQLGILVSFWALAAILIGLRSGGDLVGWGFQLQSTAFVTFLILLFVVLGLNFLGLVKVESRYAGIGQGLTMKGGLSGSFFTGVLAVIVASPCTAPFMGAAMGYGLSQDSWTTMAIFTALGVGLGSPYIFFTLFPSLVRLLPKPGQWMITLKEFLAFPMWLTAVWLLTVLATQAGPLTVASVLAASIMIGMAVWINLRAQGRKKIIWLLATFALAGAVIWVGQRHAMEQEAQSGDSWEPFDETKIADYQSQGRKVFVNFTAAWCISCQVNDQTTFKNEAVMKYVAEQNIVMMKADWTNKNDEIGRILRKFNRAGVPLYLYYSSQGQVSVLPEILTPGIFIDQVK